MSAVVWLVIVICPPGADPAPGDDEVRVTVLTVLATDRDKTVEAKLSEIAAVARKHDPALTGFRLERVSSRPVDLRQMEVFELVEGAVAEVTVQARDKKTGCYRMKVKAPGASSVSYTCCCGKFFPMLTEFKTDDGCRVIIAIMIRPCPEKR